MIFFCQFLMISYNFSQKMGATPKQIEFRNFRNLLKCLLKMSNINQFSYHLCSFYFNPKISVDNAFLETAFGLNSVFET